MVPKRTKVFICKVSFICASPVAGARNKNTLQDELFPNCAAQERNPYKTMLAAHTSKRFTRRGLGLIPTAVPVASQGAFLRRGNKPVVIFPVSSSPTRADMFIVWAFATDP